MFRSGRRARERSDLDEIKAALKRYYRLGELSKVIRSSRQLYKLQRVRGNISHKEIESKMRSLCRRYLEYDPPCFYLQHLLGKVKRVEPAR
jgi:hypothetical protein